MISVSAFLNQPLSLLFTLNVLLDAGVSQRVSKGEQSYSVWLQTSSPRRFRYPFNKFFSLFHDLKSKRRTSSTAWGPGGHIDALSTISCLSNSIESLTASFLCHPGASTRVIFLPATSPCLFTHCALVCKTNSSLPRIRVSCWTFSSILAAQGHNPHFWEMVCLTCKTKTHDLHRCLWSTGYVVTTGNSKCTCNTWILTDLLKLILQKPHAYTTSVPIPKLFFCSFSQSPLLNPCLSTQNHTS